MNESERAMRLCDLIEGIRPWLNLKIVHFITRAEYRLIPVC